MGVSLKLHVDENLVLTGRGETVSSLNSLQTISYESGSSEASALR